MEVELENMDMDTPVNDETANKSKTQPQVDADGTPIYLPDEEKKSNQDQDDIETQLEEKDTEQLVDDDKPKSKFDEPGRVRRFSTILNLLNSLLGAGILGVPRAMKYIGLIPSFILLAIIAGLSHLSTVLTVKLQKRTSAQGLDDLAKIVLGKAGSMALSILSMLFLYTAEISYIIIGSDSIMSWLRNAGLVITRGWKRSLFVFIFWALIPGALTIPRRISFISYFSIGNFIGIFFYIIFMIIKAIIVFPKQGVGEGFILATFGFGIFSAISMYSLTFALPVVALPIMNPYNKDLKKRTIVSAAAMISCFFIVAIPSVIGYTMFGEKTEDVVLKNFPDNDVLAIITRACFLVIVSASYPFCAAAIMGSWGEIIYGINNSEEIAGKKRVVVFILMNSVPLIVAMFIPNAGPVLSVGGALGGTLVDFFFPSLMWIILSKKRWFHWHNLLNILMCIFGVVASVISAYQAVLDAIESLK
jgi:amino acid permease